jgi:hypothetical protein
MAINRPTGEQIRFSSSKTGDHVLDSYMEMVERGTRTLYELLDDVFDPLTGELYEDFIQVRINDTTQELQIRSGQSLDPEARWQNSGEFILRHRGAWAASTAYKQLDVVTYNNGSYICKTSHTSTGTFDTLKFGILVDANYVSTFAANALASQNAAALSETNAASSAASALASKNTTLAAEANVVALYDNFDDRYLGVKTANPTLDNDGNALITGALYFNSVGSVMRVWDGSVWQNAAPPPSLVVAYDQEFSGDGTTTVFNLSNPPYAETVTEVFFSGIRKKPGVDYTVVGDILTFTVAPPVGTNNIYVYWTTPTGSVDQIGTSIIEDDAITYAKLQEMPAMTVLANLTGSTANPTAVPAEQLGFDPGTAMVFKQSTAPTGWTKDTTAALNDSLLRIVTGTASSGGSNNFTTVNAQTVVGNTTLSSDQMPTHTHVQNSHNHSQTNGTNVIRNTGTGSNFNSALGAVYSLQTLSNVAATATNQNTGSSDPHNHTISMSIKYNDVIVATKD